MARQGKAKQGEARRGEARQGGWGGRRLLVDSDPGEACSDGWSGGAAGLGGTIEATDGPTVSSALGGSAASRVPLAVSISRGLSAASRLLASASSAGRDVSPAAVTGSMGGSFNAEYFLTLSALTAANGLPGGILTAVYWPSQGGRGGAPTKSSATNYFIRNIVWRPPPEPTSPATDGFMAGLVTPSSKNMQPGSPPVN